MKLFSFMLVTVLIHIENFGIIKGNNQILKDNQNTEE